MADLIQLKRRYEAVKVTEDSKGKIIDVCALGINGLQRDYTN